MPRIPEIKEVVCIKDFSCQNMKFLKNKKYGLIEYNSVAGGQSFYIVNLPMAKNSIPAYNINYKQFKNFISVKELRKLKLDKINGNKLSVLYKRFFGR